MPVAAKSATTTICPTIIASSSDMALRARNFTFRKKNSIPGFQRNFRSHFRFGEVSLLLLYGWFEQLLQCVLQSKKTCSLPPISPQNKATIVGRCPFAFTNKRFPLAGHWLYLFGAITFLLSRNSGLFRALGLKHQMKLLGLGQTVNDCKIISKKKLVGPP